LSCNHSSNQFGTIASGTKLFTILLHTKQEKALRIYILAYFPAKFYEVLMKSGKGNGLPFQTVSAFMTASACIFAALSGKAATAPSAILGSNKRSSLKLSPFPLKSVNN
jgi:hypothetical protein